jgi:plastocyanin
MFRALAVAALVIAAGCGGSTGYGGPPPPPPPGPPPPPPPPGGGHSTTITVDNNFFSPTPDTVAAGTVTFTWAAGAVTHNVSWDSGPGTLPTNSLNKSSGDYQATLQNGTYGYHCTIHGAGMSGVIVVQ